MNAENLARAVIGSRATESGKIYYSPAATLRKAPLMLMGHNPGSTPGDGEEETIEHTLQSLHTKIGNDYVHEDWGRGPGNSKLQRSVRDLFDAIRVDLDTTFTTNLIFFRSQDVASSQFNHNAPYCWKLHKHFLTLIQPQILIVFGSSTWSPYAFIRGIAKSVIDHRPLDAKHGTWKVRSFTGFIEGEKRLVFGFPHLSRYKTKKECDGVVALRKAIGNISKGRP